MLNEGPEGEEELLNKLEALKHELKSNYTKSQLHHFGLMECSFPPTTRKEMEQYDKFQQELKKINEVQKQLKQINKIKKKEKTNDNGRKGNCTIS